MSLDLETLFFASAISRCAYLVVFLVTALSQPGERCLWHWIGALLCSMIGAFITSRLPPTEDLDTVSAVLVYALFGASLSLSWSGLRFFYGLPVRLPFLGGLTLLPAAAYMFLHLAGASAQTSVSGVFLACMLLTALSIAEITKPSQQERLWSQYVVAAAFLCYFLVFAASVATIAFTDLTTRTMESGRLAIIIDQVTGILIYFGYLAMAGERANLGLRRLAETDLLTGLHNRRGLDSQAKRHGAQARTSLLIADIDHFKSINDTHGHQTGDMVLKAFAERMKAALRTGDIAVRWGGEEFLAVLPATTADQAAVIAERLRFATEQEPFQTASGPIAVTVSIGIADVERSEEDLQPATRRADAALYVAKSSGRNRVASAPDRAA
ncbi:hypothetical protein ASG43_14495 [Aureimonas sp. Leaf454]|uniref:GGDEF domain-containing protein n=1 Tax=Aureimonas sp. Leaf454 TaxID=1736381 RepID=UPI0006F2FD50|nr:GGDEF domain-containing protein [Aureimonas sp. Leaf454]KQT44537.1 hypothetical protein ASG43_14495 [Aureimonas sp. Leaf454]